MDIQKISQSRYGVGFALLLGRLLPPKLGYFVGNRIADFVATRKASPMIQAIRANQWVVQGEHLTSPELDQAVRMVLRHAARCAVDLYHTLTDPEKIKALSPPTPMAIELIRKSRTREQGYFIVAPHLSNFDLVFLANGFRGLQGMVLTYGQPTSGYDMQNRIREKTGLDITPVRGEETHQLAIERLKNNEFVITAVDRPIRRKPHRLTFFGRPSPLPAGHIRMALAANVPIIVAAARMNPSGIYELLTSDPIEMIHFDDPDKAIRVNAEKVLKVMEDFIRQAPTQWLMYYPVWPEVLDLMP